MPQITPVILCGGGGERLWPLSRKSYPKQFLNLLGDGSLFQQATTRLRGAAPLVITVDDYRFIVRQQLHEAGVDTAEVIIEPEGRNTAPAILAAACDLATHDEEAIMLVMPSDHYIPDAGAFAAMAEKAAANLGKVQIICFGITPTGRRQGMVISGWVMASMIVVGRSCQWLLSPKNRMRRRPRPSLKMVDISGTQGSS